MKKFPFLALAVTSALSFSALAETVRDPAQVRAFKKLHFCPATKRPTGPCGGYVVDHFVPLFCKGRDHPDNMRWMTVTAGKLKDKWELKSCATLKQIETKNKGMAPDPDFKHPTWYVTGPHK